MPIRADEWRMEMSDTTRKAVVTTAQVAAAFANYVAALVKIGNTDSVGNEFDKGLRGRGFAEYTSAGNIVRTFDTKDDALTHYSLLAQGMWTVLDTLPSEVPAEPVSEVEAPEVKPATRRSTKAA